MRTLARLVLTLLASTAIVTGVSAAASAAPPTITVDCQTNNEGQYAVYVKPGDTVELTITTCDEYGTFDDNNSSYTQVQTLTGGETLQLSAPGNPADYYVFLKDNGDYWFYIWIIEAGPDYPHPGTLLLTETATIPATPQEFTLTTSLGVPHLLGGNDTCALDVASYGEHVYSTIDITILTAGTYTFRGLYSEPKGSWVPDPPAIQGAQHPLEDPFLAVYQDFDPSQPDQGILGCNDDLSDVEDEAHAILTTTDFVVEGHQPYFTATLQPGHYSLVLTTYEAISAADWAVGWAPTFAYSFEVGPASTTFELWGPEGGLVPGHVAIPSGSSNNQPQLPDTGTSLLPTALIALGALLAGGLAGGLAIGRRRRRA